MRIPKRQMRSSVLAHRVAVVIFACIVCPAYLVAVIIDFWTIRASATAGFSAIPARTLLVLNAQATIRKLCERTNAIQARTRAQTLARISAALANYAHGVTMREHGHYRRSYHWFQWRLCAREQQQEAQCVLHAFIPLLTL